VIETSRLAPYLGTVFALFIAPGPSVVFVVSRGVALGLRAALIAVAGNTLGLSTQLAIVVLGPGLLNSKDLFHVLKILGALYLVYLGIRTIRTRRAFAEALESERVASRTQRQLIRQGWVVGVTNPKGLITYTSIAPDFIHTTSGSDTLALAALGAIGVLVAVVCDGAWGLASGTVRRWLGESSRRAELLNAAGGVLMVLFGIVLAVIAIR
jgi:threonine/homoserine/homoserine lactone efflux protein